MQLGENDEKVLRRKWKFKMKRTLNNIWEIKQIRQTIKWGKNRKKILRVGKYISDKSRTKKIENTRNKIRNKIITNIKNKNLVSRVRTNSTKTRPLI